jgi:hypothetical protein
MCCFTAQRVTCGATNAAPDQASYATGSSCEGGQLRSHQGGRRPRAGGGAPITLLMCRCNRGDGAGASESSTLIAGQVRGQQQLWPMSPARRLSDQDIMARYRMNPPARGRPPGLAPRGALPPAPQSGGKRARRPLRVTRPFAAADVGVIDLLAVECLNLEDLVAKTRGLRWGCGEVTTRSY